MNRDFVTIHVTEADLSFYYIVEHLRKKMIEITGVEGVERGGDKMNNVIAGVYRLGFSERLFPSGKFPSFVIA